MNRVKIPENLKYILTLTIICFVTASLLTGVYLLTGPRIIEQKTRQEKQALKEIFPEAGYFEPVSREGESNYFRAYLDPDKSELLGFAFKTQAQGYSSTIESIAGMDIQGRITGIKIVEQNETPGLGAKISEVLTKKTIWQAIKELFLPGKRIPELPRKPWFCAQFKGKEIKDLVVVKTPTEKNIQAITGATISSEALTNSVRERANQILKYEE